MIGRPVLCSYLNVPIVEDIERVPRCERKPAGRVLDFRQPMSTSLSATTTSTNSVSLLAESTGRELLGKLLRTSAVFRLRKDLVDRIAYLLRRRRVCGEIDACSAPCDASANLRLVLAHTRYHHGHAKAERLRHRSVATEGDQHIHLGQNLAEIEVTVKQ